MYEFDTSLHSFPPFLDSFCRVILQSWKSFNRSVENINIISIFSFLRHVVLPKEIAKRVPKTHLMSEAEWRAIGIQMSPGWIHYMIHRPGKFA